MAMYPLILICDDDPVVHESLGLYLSSEGYEHQSAYDGQQALEMVESLHPDMVVLDLMMPRMSGIDVCRTIRQTSSIPIIMLTAKGEEIDRILGLELGADDYIVKPFSPREVLARIKAVLRRFSEKTQDEDSSIIRLPQLEISLENYQVKAAGKIIPCPLLLQGLCWRKGNPPSICRGSVFQTMLLEIMQRLTVFSAETA